MIAIKYRTNRAGDLLTDLENNIFLSNLQNSLNFNARQYSFSLPVLKDTFYKWDTLFYKSYMLDEISQHFYRQSTQVCGCDGLNSNFTITTTKYRFKSKHYIKKILKCVRCGYIPLLIYFKKSLNAIKYSRFQLTDKEFFDILEEWSPPGDRLEKVREYRRLIGV